MIKFFKALGSGVKELRKYNNNETMQVTLSFFRVNSYGKNTILHTPIFIEIKKLLSRLESRGLVKDKKVVDENVSIDATTPVREMICLDYCGKLRNNFWFKLFFRDKMYPRLTGKQCIVCKCNMSLKIRSKYHHCPNKLW